MKKVDVLVAGGGLAGCAAAIAAARGGARTLLVERGPYLGGNATRAMVAPWQSFHASTHDGAALCGGDTSSDVKHREEQTQPDVSHPADAAMSPSPSATLPRQVIGGIAQEFVNDLVARGACLGHVVDPIGFAGSLTPVDADALKLYLPEKLTEAGVEFRLGRETEAAELQDAGFVIDATGQAAAAALLGAPLLRARELQPFSWLFTMEQVDIAAIREYQLAHRDQFVLHPAIEQLPENFIAVSGFFELVAQARASGELTLPRDRLLFFSTPRAGEVLINTTRIPASHLEPRVEGLRQVGELADWLPRRVPGFLHARLGRVADDLGEREATRLQGRYQLSVDDLLAGRQFEDAVARGCYPIDIHRADSDELATRELGGQGWYDIPLRCLQAPGIDNLLVAGRCISADAEGFASARTLPTAMATGQAAGMLASMKIAGREFDTLACVSAVSLV